jgi:hypothetical protein
VPHVSDEGELPNLRHREPPCPMTSESLSSLPA